MSKIRLCLFIIKDPFFDITISREGTLLKGCLSKKSGLLIQISLLFFHLDREREKKDFLEVNFFAELLDVSFIEDYFKNII